MNEYIFGVSLYLYDIFGNLLTYHFELDIMVLSTTGYYLFYNLCMICHSNWTLFTICTIINVVVIYTNSGYNCDDLRSFPA